MQAFNSLFAFIKNIPFHLNNTVTQQWGNSNSNAVIYRRVVSCAHCTVQCCQVSHLKSKLLLSPLSHTYMHTHTKFTCLLSPILFWENPQISSISLYGFKNPGSFWIAFLHQLQLSVGKEIQNTHRKTFSLIGNASNSRGFLICSKVLPHHLTGRPRLHALWLGSLKCWAIQCCQP